MAAERSALQQQFEAAQQQGTAVRAEAAELQQRSEQLAAQKQEFEDRQQRLQSEATRQLQASAGCGECVVGPPAGRPTCMAPPQLRCLCCGKSRLLCSVLDH